MQTDQRARTSVESNATSPKVKSLGGFELIQKIGQGGMGSVFKARQVSLDRIVALKILPASIAKDVSFIDRFQREARACGHLNHASIVQGIDVGKDDATGLWYFAMEYVDGPTLRHVLKEKKKLPEREVLEIVRAISGALEYTARHNIVHRDIKPDNIIMTTRGEPKLADLGLARQLDDDSSMTQTGKAIGTPHYMAPEQVRGIQTDIDIRTDIYALGATMFHLMTGQTPFTGETSAVVMAHHLTTPAPNAHKIEPSISEACAKLIQTMMQKDRAQRIQTPTELHEKVERLLSGTGEHKRTPRTAAAGVASRKRNTTSALDPVDEEANKPAVHQNPKGLMIALVAVTVIAVVGAVFALVGGSKEKPPVAKAPEPPAPAKPTTPTSTQRTPTVESTVAATRTDIDDRLKAAQTWDAEHPDAWNDSLQRYKTVLDDARNSSLEFRKQITQSMDAVKARQQAAFDGEWKKLDAKISDILAKDGYDAALAACEKKAETFPDEMTPRQDEKARAMRVEAEAKVDAILARAAKPEVAKDDALKILGEAEALNYGVARERIAKAKATHFELTEAPLAVQTETRYAPPPAKIVQAVEPGLSETKWTEIQTAFDKLYLEQGNLAGARDAVSKTLKEVSSDPRAAALQALIGAYDDLKQRDKDVLAHLPGAQIDWPVFPGKLTKVLVKKSDEATFTFECSMGNGANMSKTIKVADLNAEDRKRVFGIATPTNDAQRVAMALLSLQKGKEDYAKAGDLLKASGEFPLTAHYMERIKSVHVASKELDAEKDWAAIEAAAKTLKTERDGKAVLEKINAFEAEHNGTAYIKIMGDKINVIKTNAQLAGVASVIENADFETGTLDRWEVKIDPRIGDIDNVKNGELSKRCVSIKGSREASYISQQVRVTPGDKYVVTATVQIVENGKDEKGGARLTINDNKGKPLDEARKSTPRYSWEHMESKFTAKSELVTIELGAFYPGQNSSATVRFDNVKIMKQK